MFCAAAAGGGGRESRLGLCGWVRVIMARALLGCRGRIGDEGEDVIVERSREKSETEGRGDEGKGEVKVQGVELFRGEEATRKKSKAEVARAGKWRSG
ncbi:unnamed protein product [Sphenostylis stenocarpa]|uniref:Uncharacterized protein n=1 Tax=Sphenostylis stenocarpa TaxID=92480 RepID=A0AA86TCD0_9FABA|nr:unnamed protein product [Sphenostylis stenocarpa]